MNNIGLFIIFGAATVYFGLKVWQILPICIKLLQALITGALKWPGPRIHDTNSSASRVREQLGVGYENLFQTFLFNTMVVLAAFIFSLLNLIGIMPAMNEYIQIDWTFTTIGLSFIAFIGGQMGATKAQEYVVQVKTVFTDLAQAVEPRAVDSRSIRSAYAIEHPLLGNRNLPPNTKRALDQFYESVRYHQDGNELKALNLYNEATRLDPDIHKNARAALLTMTEGRNLTDEGAINYWLGIHSEWLSDRRNAATYYENAINAYSQIGYNKRASRACNNLGSVKMQLGDPDTMEQFDRAISLDPQNGMAYMSIGIIYYRISERGDPRFDTAMNAFADAIVTDPVTYKPIVLSRMRSIGYTWKEDWEDVLMRTLSRQPDRKTNSDNSEKKADNLKSDPLSFKVKAQSNKLKDTEKHPKKEIGFDLSVPVKKTTKTYCNKKYGFEIDFPIEWMPAPTIPKQGNKDLFQYGCYDEAFNFEIGSLSPEPPLDQTELDFMQFMLLKGYKASKFDRIVVNGKEHVCACYCINDWMGQRWNKKYMIVFRGIEFAITATCNDKTWFDQREKDWDIIVKTFRLSGKIV